MTKSEIKKCEELMCEAIRKASNSMTTYKNYDLLLRQNITVAHINLREADQDYGYAKGIYQVLVSIGFKNEDMKALENLL